MEFLCCPLTLRPIKAQIGPITEHHFTLALFHHEQLGCNGFFSPSAISKGQGLITAKLSFSSAVPVSQPSGHLSSSHVALCNPSLHLNQIISLY